MPPREVEVLAEAQAELRRLPPREAQAVAQAVRKLEALGEELGHPHTTAIQGSRGTLRELRPRQGDSPWRVFYRRIGEVLVIAAVGPEATVKPRDFRRVVALAEERLSRWESAQ
ncbi:MAG: type II toxin-antitoxin system RelE/ParE family toxin [Anaerolineales bacterium]|nr:type II toxin-antitoxin system RelE/ParE family toxin [Anaerolineales bacterium]